MLVIVLAEHTPEQASQQSDPALTLLGLLTVVIVGYLGHCGIAPYKDCATCKDKKKWRSSMSSNVFRLCARCRGCGKEYRLGTRLMRGTAGYGWGRHE